MPTFKCFEKYTPVLTRTLTPKTPFNARLWIRLHEGGSGKIESHVGCVGEREVDGGCVDCRHGARKGEDDGQCKVRRVEYDLVDIR